MLVVNLLLNHRDILVKHCLSQVYVKIYVKFSILMSLSLFVEQYDVCVLQAGC